MDITTEIEKTIKSMFKGPRGDQVANLYHKYSSLINFTIIYGIGILLNTFLVNLNSFLGIIIALVWTWVMTVGPLGHLWGFKPTPEKKKREEVKPINEKWKKGVKKQTIKYREVENNTEKIETPEGPMYAEASKDYVIQDEKGNLYPISKKQLDETYEHIGDEKK